jgi:hypothetical protein
MARLLATLAETDLLSFPLKLEHQDRPDFVLTMPTGCVGIEVTTAEHPDLGKALAINERKYSGRPMHAHSFPPGKKRTNAEIEDIASGHDRGRGWGCDEAEREWADSMTCVVTEKASNLAKPGYQRRDNAWLVIYDNLFFVFGHEKRQKAATYFLESVGTMHVMSFERIFIEKGQNVLEFLASDYIDRPLNDLWRRSAD